MLCWTGRRNECEPCGLSKNQKHTLRIQMMIRSIVILIPEFNSHTLCAELGIRYISYSVMYNFRVIMSEVHTLPFCLKFRNNNI